MTKNRAILIEKLNRPIFVGVFAWLIAALYAVFSLVKFSGDKLFNQFYYVIPIIFPFVFFLSGRFLKYKEPDFWVKSVDFLVVLTAMWRVFGDVPYVSGHSLFLAYAIITARTNIDFWLAGVVLTEVGILKIFFWNDWLTFSVGLVLGIIAGFVTRRFLRNKQAAN